MESAWRTKTNLRKEIPSKIVALASEARLNNYWIYHKPTKKWFTPDEFLKHGPSHYHVRRGEDNSDEFAIMDPMDGLRARIDTLKKVSEEIISFQNRINDYYFNRTKK